MLLLVLWPSQYTIRVPCAVSTFVSFQFFFRLHFFFSFAALHFCLLQLIKLSRRELFVSFSAIMSVIYTDVRETHTTLHSPQSHLNDFHLVRSFVSTFCFSFFSLMLGNWTLSRRLVFVHFSTRNVCLEWNHRRWRRWKRRRTRTRRWKIKWFFPLNFIHRHDHSDTTILFFTLNAWRRAGEQKKCIRKLN